LRLCSPQPNAFCADVLQHARSVKGSEKLRQLPGGELDRRGAESVQVLVRYDGSFQSVRAQEGWVA
jgi:hypothetical protein